MFLTTDKLDPNRQSAIETFDQKLLEVLPKDYIHFLREYGTGTYCDEVIITYPDSQNIPLTYRNYTDLWELNENYNVDDLLKSIQIGWTSNGDIICITEKRGSKIFVLPRHSMTIATFATFNDTIKSFAPDISTSYFDPTFNIEQKQISLIKSSGSLIDISPIHELFLQKFPYDFITHETTQPKYFFKRFGGWVSFDLIYKNSITIKYQGQHFDNALPIINYITAHCI